MTRLRLFASIFSLSLSLLLAAQIAGATECETRDFRPILGATRDQKQADWCFAYPAADLVTQKTGVRVSGEDMAISFHLRPVKGILNSANPDVRKYLADHPEFLETLGQARSPGAVEFITNRKSIYLKLTDPDEGDPTGIGKELRAMPELASRKKFAKSNAASFSEEHLANRDHGLIAEGGEVIDAVLLANAAGLCPEKNFHVDDREVEHMLKDAIRWHKDQERKLKANIGVPQDDPTSSVVTAGGNAVMQHFLAEVDRRCQRLPNKTPLIPVEVTNADLFTDVTTFVNYFIDDPKGRKVFQDGLLTRIDGLLDANRAVAIHYDAGLLQKPAANDTEPGDHAGLIAGRKLIGGKCHYLLRNGWGTGCEGYRSKFKGRCEAGQFWVTGPELMNEGNVISLTYLR